MNTLFLKESVLFISKDGKEYEVLEQDIRLSIDGDRGSIPAKRVIENLGKIEWPGGVELIEHYYDKNKGECGITMCYSQSENIKDKCLKWCRTVARLLPKEKKNLTELYKKFAESKEFKKAYCNRPLGDVISYTESDYKQFEEPARTNSADELSGKPEPLPITDAIIDSEAGERLNKLVESSEPQEKGKYCFGVTGGVHSPIHSFESQEEMMKELIKAVKDRESAIYCSDFYENEADFINSQLKKFSITRLTP